MVNGAVGGVSGIQDQVSVARLSLWPQSNGGVVVCRMANVIINIIIIVPPFAFAN